jgi:ataxia telangiectasia mutated family protein
MGKKDSFFIRLVVLFETIDDAAEELLPLLVQSSLSIWLSGSGKNSAAKNELKDRQHSLSVYFTKVLQYPSASVETVKAVIDIMLHLRNYHPPYRTDELGYEAWLDIDHLLLSQSALKCGSFATSLMFLDFSRDDLTGEAKIQLTDQRVQNVSTSLCWELPLMQVSY